MRINEEEEESHHSPKGGMNSESSFSGSDSSPSPQKSISPHKSPIKENLGPVIQIGDF